MYIIFIFILVIVTLGHIISCPIGLIEVIGTDEFIKTLLLFIYGIISLIFIWYDTIVYNKEHKKRCINNEKEQLNRDTDDRYTCSGYRSCAISNPPPTPNETDSSISLSKDEDVSDTDTKSSEVDKDIVIFGSKDIILTKNDSCTFDILVDDSIDKIVLKSDTTDDLFTYTLDMGETTKMYTLKIIGGTETGSCKIWLEGNTGVVSDIINFTNEKVIEQPKPKESSKQESSSKEESKQESSKQESKTEVKEYKTYSYDTLARNPDKYSGEHIKLYGEVIQVQESDSWFSDDTSVELRVDMTPTKSSYAKSGFNWDDTVYVKYTYKSDEDKILEDDIVEIRGTIWLLLIHISIR